MNTLKKRDQGKLTFQHSDPRVIRDLLRRLLETECQFKIDTLNQVILSTFYKGVWQIAFKNKNTLSGVSADVLLVEMSDALDVSANSPSSENYLHELVRKYYFHAPDVSAKDHLRGLPSLVLATFILGEIGTLFCDKLEVDILQAHRNGYIDHETFSVVLDPRPLEAGDKDPFFPFSE